MSNPICLTIAHNVYLTREQRYALVNGENIVVAGASVLVWLNNKTSESAEEIFCYYYLNNLEPLFIKNIDDGYIFNLPFVMLQGLRDVKKLGNECLMFTNKNNLIIREKSYYAIHYVNIQDISILNSLSIKR